MSVLTTGTMAEEMAKRPQFIPLADNLYVLEVHDVKLEMGQTYDGTGEEEKIVITFKVKNTIDGTPLIDIEGNYPKNDLLKTWCNPKSVGFNVKTNQPHKTRQILTAILGIPIESPIEINDWNDLVGKKVKAYISVTNKTDGTKGNKLDKFSAFESKKK